MRPKPISGGADAYSSGREGVIGLLRGGPDGPVAPRSFACSNAALVRHPPKRLPLREYRLMWSHILYVTHLPHVHDVHLRQLRTCGIRRVLKGPSTPLIAWPP